MTATKRSESNFGPLEAAVMDAVWSAGEPLTVRRIVDDLNSRRADPLAYTTVMTVMGRLAEKGALRRHKEGRSFLYEAGAPDAAGLAVKEVLGTYGDAAIAHFLEEARDDPQIMARLRGVLNEADG